MGENLSRRVLAPSTAGAYEQGKSDTSVRDSIRSDWKA
jgi:hypothetical protein